jgi:redox-sensitive bicupin YhaK (pirin superfamily)
MSPGDLGERVKPFVFLDIFDFAANQVGSMPLHPHSGIATVTVVAEGNLRFDDPASGSGHIDFGGVEWMRAGSGVWHGKELSRGTSARVKGFQLWLALPPELENGSVESAYLESEHIPSVGPARVILGQHGGAASPVKAPQGITYLLVSLEPGERWTYQPAAGETVAWLAVATGRLDAGTVVEAGAMAIFADGESSVELEAVGQGKTIFVLGSARPHAHDLVTGYYSIHTNEDALIRGEARIVELKKHLDQARTDGGTGSVPVFSG